MEFSECDERLFSVRVKVMVVESVPKKIDRDHRHGSSSRRSASVRNRNGREFCSCVHEGCLQNMARNFQLYGQRASPACRFPVCRSNAHSSSTKRQSQSAICTSAHDVLRCLYFDTLCLARKYQDGEKERDDRNKCFSPSPFRAKVLRHQEKQSSVQTKTIE